jgi:uncharacterized protein
VATLHLSVPVRDLREATGFYCDVLGCRLGRVAERWVDVWFFGLQLTLQLRPDEVRPAADQGARHFGVTLDDPEAFDQLVTTLASRGVEWITPPTAHPDGELSGKREVKVADPSGNVIEIKHYEDATAYRAGG